MVNIIRALFGLSHGIDKHDAHRGQVDPYQRFLAASLDEIRHCTSIPDLSAYLEHANGYLREAALARAVELGSPDLLAGMCARLNDWVPQVRRAAKKALLTLIPAVPPEALLAQLPAIDRLLLAQREDHAGWMRVFEDTLLAWAGPERIVAGIQNESIRHARACFRIARQHGLVPAALLIETALRSNDIRIAIDAMAMTGGLPEPERHALYLAALASPFGAVRTVALRALLALPGSDAETLARSCLFDPQSSVRFLASTHLERHGIDADALYIDRLCSPDSGADDMRICLLALAARGRAPHAAWMEAYAASPIPRVQMAALMGWVRLVPSHKDDIAVLALRSPVARVRKLAVTLIRDAGAYVPSADALAMAEAQRDYRLMLRLARQTPWTWIETIARLARRSDLTPGMRDVLAEDLRMWASRSGSVYIAPEPEQCKLLQDAATQAALTSLLPDHHAVYQRIAYTIAHVGRQR